MKRQPQVARSMDGIQTAGRNSHPAVLGKPKRKGFSRGLGLLLVVLILIVAIVLTIIPQATTLASSLVPLWRPGTYLVLFENDAELRPTGGFIGSYAVVYVHSNRTFDYSINTNIYKVDDAFTAEHSIMPPAPFKGITDKWSLRDSNWDIDFANASKTIEWFYKQETGESVDGVIAVTAQAGKQLLGAIGPVSLSDGTKLGDNSSFYDTLAYKIEKQYFFASDNRSVNEPKQLLVNLVPQIRNRLMSPVNDFRLVSWLDSMLETKQIIMNFNDDRQTIVESRGWADRVESSSQQYLSLNSANIGGLKSSQHMTQSVELSITTIDSTHVKYQLVLTRTHHGTGVWPDNTNNNLVRILIPRGSAIQTADVDGDSVVPDTEEEVNNRLCLGFRMNTDPGKTKQLSATILVPIDSSLVPEFVWQKQPGVSFDDLIVAKDGQTLLHGSIDRDARVMLH